MSDPWVRVPVKQERSCRHSGCGSTVHPQCSSGCPIHRNRDQWRVIDFGQFRLRPALFFDFGQFRLRPISTSANFWMMNFGTTKCGALKGWAPKDGPQRVEAPNLEKVGPRRVGPRRVGPRRVGPRRVGPRRVGGPKFRVFFSVLRHNFLSSFSLLGSLRGILMVFEAPGT